MDQRKIPQHVRINSKIYEKELSPNEILVYANLKMYMNKDYEAFPSQTRLKEDTGLSVPTIKSCLDKLKDAGEIEIRREGRKNIYKFNTQSKHFEMYSFEFLKDESLTSQQKAFLIATQRHIYKNTPNVGKLSYTNKELAEKINTSEVTVYRRNSELTHKDILTTYPVKDKDGNEIFVRVYNLAQIHQEFVTLKEQVLENTEDIALLKKTVKEQGDLIKQLMKSKVDDESTTKFVM